MTTKAITPLRQRSNYLIHSESTPAPRPPSTKRNLSSNACAPLRRQGQADRALSIIRANLGIHLARMLFAELPQLFALKTSRSCSRAFSSLRAL